MKLVLRALLVGLLLSALPAVSHSQEKGGQLPAKGDDEIQAEAGGKKSNKVKVKLSDTKGFELEGFPEGPLRNPKLDSLDLALLDKVEKLVPGLGAKVKTDLPTRTNLRDRIVYLVERVAKLLERVDHLEANKKKNLVSQKKVDDVEEARKLLITMEIGYSDRYFDFLDRTLVKEAADHFQKVYNHKFGKHVDSLFKQQDERRKKLGLPAIERSPKSKDK